MICKNCGMTIEDGSKFCVGCGEVVETSEEQKSAPVYFTQPPETVAKEFKEEDIPPQYRRLGAWSYFGLNVLFNIPIVGFVFLIVFSFSRGNLNRRSYARSYWCTYLVLAGVFLLFLIFSLVLGFSLRDVVSNTRLY